MADPVAVDPFDLPEALGTADVVWRADDGLTGHLVRGTLEPTGGDPLPCDLLAVDDAYPLPVADEGTRLVVHQAWRHGQVHLASYDGRVTLLVPGTAFTAEVVLDAVSRFAKALGAAPSSYAVLLRLGS
ncbi:hypothetical protein [Nocardioides sp.]|uniref:hypothetical protein n=1 Tax=Nocardioides sp. TaxID=35761 RepID=UPI002722F7F7|nr:hypothetical protein [Nocardioides sp.]MDO9454607.1 hypothetical protein [Nocardioides sp.]